MVTRCAREPSSSANALILYHFIYLLMKRPQIVYWTMASALTFAATANAEILVGLSPDLPSALYDSDKKGFVSDGNVQPPANPSGVPVIGTTGANLLSSGFTFNVTFTPVASDLNGTKILIELGGNSNGTGLYLIGGVPTLLSKQGAQTTTTPDGLNDRTLPSIAVQSDIGKLEAGVVYSFSASWNHNGTVELIAKPDGAEGRAFNSFIITGVPGDWPGNETLSVKTLNTGNAGGLGRDTAANTTMDPRFNTNVGSVASFAGTIQRAIFWNANDVVPPVHSEPEVKGFSVTRLPTTGKLRLHWNVSEGGLPNPTTVEIRETGVTGGSPLYVVPSDSLVGFVDLETTVTSFTLVATNPNGTDDATAAPEADTAHSSVIRASNPLAWYRFNEAVGSKFLVDSAENAIPNDGTLRGDQIAGGSGFIDGAGVYAGSSTILNRQILNPGSTDPEIPKGFSIEAVLKHSSASTAVGTLISQQDAEGGTGRQIIAVRANGTLYSVLGGTTIDSTLKLVPDAWSHVVFVVDPDRNQFRWYLNGKLEQTITPTEPYVLESTTGGWVIGSGKDLSSNLYKGQVDEIAVYRDLLDDPNRDGDLADSKISTHHQGWYQLTKGIIFFRGSASTVVTATPLDLLSHLGADVTAVSISDSIGNVPIDADRKANQLGVQPTASTTYTLTATGPGVTYTADFTVTYNQLTLPVILGFEATSLPSPDGVVPDKVRLHWGATAGDFATPVDIDVTWGTSGLLESTELRGFVDVPLAEASNFKIKASNLIGDVERVTGAPAADTPYSAAVRAAKPVAWYRFNEAVSSGLIVDSAVNDAPHNGVLKDNLPVNLGASGFIDGAATFNAAAAIITDRIINPNDENLVGFTIEAIIETNPAAANANRVIVSQQDTSPFTGRQILSIEDGGTLRANVGGGTNVFSTDKVPVRAWSHVVGVVDVAFNRVRWYIDGKFAGTATTGFFETSQGAWIIGSAKGLDANFFRGKIDDLIIYDKILDDLDGDGLLGLEEDGDGTAPTGDEDSLIAAQRAAWWQETSGLIYSAVTSETINVGDSIDLTLKVGADATSVDVDGVPVTLVGGNAVVPLNPSSTRTYTITINTPNGPVTKTYTITVNGGAAALEIISHRIENGNFIINFKGAASTTYAVKGSTDLGSFAIDHGTAPTDTNGDGVATIPIDPLKTSEFFRIELTN